MYFTVCGAACIEFCITGWLTGCEIGCEVGWLDGWTGVWEVDDFEVCPFGWTTEGATVEGCTTDGSTIEGLIPSFYGYYYLSCFLVSVEVLDEVLEVLEVVGVSNSATFLTALAIVLNALFVFDAEEIVEGILEDFSGSDLAASSKFL